MSERIVRGGTLVHLARQYGAPAGPTAVPTAPAYTLGPIAPQEAPQAEPDEARDLLDRLRSCWIDASDLPMRQYPPIRWVIDGVLPEGLTLLAGRAKVGKSWLALEWLYAVGCGEAWGGHDVEGGCAAYVALEDGARRLQSRARMGGYGAEPGRVLLVDRSGSDDMWVDGALSVDRLAWALGAFRDPPRLLVIDTLTAAAGSRDQNDAQAMEALLRPLQRMAEESRMSVVLVDHMRKGAGRVGEGMQADPIEHVGGSRAKAAAADAVYGLYRAEDGTLGLSGELRDGAPVALRLMRDERMRHRVEVAEPPRPEDSLRGHARTVWDVLPPWGPDGMSVEQIAESSGVARSSVSSALARLRSMGLAEEDRGGRTYTRRRGAA